MGSDLNFWEVVVNSKITIGGTDTHKYQVILHTYSNATNPASHRLIMARARRREQRGEAWIMEMYLICSSGYRGDGGCERGGVVGGSHKDVVH